ncbi:unnamed protein product, partial [Phaeothamnion confervicola]
NTAAAASIAAAAAAAATGLRGRPASVAAALLGPFSAGTRVLLGPVIGRVTQHTAIVLVEIDADAAVACCLTNPIADNGSGGGGGICEQMRLLQGRRPYAFYFDALRPGTHYEVTLGGVVNGSCRRGSLMTLPIWEDRRVAPILAAATASAGGCDVGRVLRNSLRQNGGDTCANLAGPDSASIDNNDDGGGGGGGAADGRYADSAWAEAAAVLWRPWGPIDLIVHAGGQVSLRAAVREALLPLALAESEPDGSEERRTRVGEAMECLRDAYRLQWGLPGPRRFLAHGSHLMLRGAADAGMDNGENNDDDADDSSGCVGSGGAGYCGGCCSGDNSGGWHDGSPPISGWVRATLARLVRRAFREYQRQLWRPDSLPLEVDMTDTGSASYGAGVMNGTTGGSSICDGAGSGDFGSAGSGGFNDGRDHGDGTGEWHFHAFGDIFGIFLMDLNGPLPAWRGVAATMPLVADAQWRALAAALAAPRLQALCVVSDRPFVTDSLADARH